MRNVITAALLMVSASCVHAQWRYDEGKDEMRGTVTAFAELRSSNAAQLRFPYAGGSTLSILLRQSGQRQDAMIVVSKGQFVCGLDGCRYAVKFDDKLEQISLSRASSGSSDVLFVSNSTQFIKQLRSAKAVIVEVEFYDHGREQFTFAPAGLNWPLSSAAAKK